MRKKIRVLSLALFWKDVLEPKHHRYFILSLFGMTITIPRKSSCHGALQENLNPDHGNEIWNDMWVCGDVLARIPRRKRPHEMLASSQSLRHPGAAASVLGVPGYIGGERLARVRTLQWCSRPKSPRSRSSSLLPQAGLGVENFIWSVGVLNPQKGMQH